MDRVLDGHKIAHNTTTSKAREKNKHRFEILIILENFDACLTKLKNNQILLTKISHRFQVTTKLFFTGRRSSFDRKVNVNKIYFWKMFQYYLVTLKEERRVRECQSERRAQRDMKREIHVQSQREEDRDRFGERRTKKSDTNTE